MLGKPILQLKTLLAFLHIINSGEYLGGKYLLRFERALSEYHGAKHAFGVASGTDALMIALKACGIKPGDEVITPALGIIPTASAITWIGARPVFVDVEANTLVLDPEKIEAAITPSTKAIIPVHLLGQIVDMRHIAAIAKKRNLFVIEDAARALGAKRDGYTVGSLSDAACLSFNPTKLLGGYGDGGAIITNREDLAEKIHRLRYYGAKTLRTVGLPDSILGISSRLNPFQAVVLGERLKHIDSILEEWRRNFYLYRELLSDTGDIVFPRIDSGHFVNGTHSVILTSKKDELKKYLRARDIDARNQYTYPLPYLEAFSYLGYKKGDFPVTESISDRALTLPTSNNFGENNIRRIAEFAKEFFSPQC